MNFLRWQSFSKQAACHMSVYIWLHLYFSKINTDNWDWIRDPFVLDATASRHLAGIVLWLQDCLDCDCVDIQEATPADV